MDHAPYDTRRYPIVEVREGYGEWAPTYEQTVQDEMDLRLLERLRTVDWSTAPDVLDLACGTGRIGAWLHARGVGAIDGVDLTPDMLERAARRRVYRALHVADVSSTRLRAVRDPAGVLSVLPRSGRRGRLRAPTEPSRPRLHGRCKPVAPRRHDGPGVSRKRRDLRAQRFSDLLSDRALRDVRAEAVPRSLDAAAIHRRPARRCLRFPSRRLGVDVPTSLIRRGPVRDYFAVVPPSITSSLPVTYEASSEAR